MTPALLVVVAVGFAWSMGAHYTGACMGMPYSLRVVGARQALLIMAPLALVGAAFASHGVERTVAHRLTTTAPGTGAEVVIVAVAFALTTIYNRLKVPTSTIQILVFSVVGTSLGAGLGVRWTTIGTLAIVWVLAPVVAAGLGYVLTRLLSSVGAALPAAWGRLSWPLLGAGLVVVGGAASFTMGGNDVANATGALVAVHAFSPLTAGAVGGAGLASGVLTYGRKLLDRVAFEIVELDRAMATAAQAVQAAVVLLAVSLGFFTSMNQALVGAMTGAGAARGRHVVKRATLAGIVRGWFVGPPAALAAGLLVSRLCVLAGVRLR